MKCRGIREVSPLIRRAIFSGARYTLARCLSTSSSADLCANEQRLKIKRIFDTGRDGVGSSVTVQGWVRTIRSQKKFSFIELNDGSTVKGMQIVADAGLDSYAEVIKLTTGAAAEIRGTIVASPGKGQSIEIQATEVRLVGDCPADMYPLQKKHHSAEFLRAHAHLRARTASQSAVARVRSCLSQATHEFFASEDFVHVHTPIITSSDCEGAGEMFRVTALPLHDIEALPRGEGKEGKKQIDFSQDFFGKPTFLTVSGQLSAETYACALGDVYTFGPTFRAEHSQTTKHLGEFNMIEPEMAFSDMKAAMRNAEKFVKFVVNKSLKTCEQDLSYLDEMVAKNSNSGRSGSCSNSSDSNSCTDNKKGTKKEQSLSKTERETPLLSRLKDIVHKPFAVISYADAVKLLQVEIAKDPTKWQYPDISFGSDMGTEHERWLCDTHFNGSCVFVHNYPREIKSFYMRDNDEDNGRTVDAFDLLVPGIGELIGGSQREERLDVLQRKMRESGMNSAEYEWYLDLRRFGTVPHSGYGLGFERLVTLVTGVDNIREAIPFPRYYGSAEF